MNKKMILHILAGSVLLSGVMSSVSADMAFAMIPNENREQMQDGRGMPFGGGFGGPNMGRPNMGRSDMGSQNMNSQNMAEEPGEIKSGPIENSASVLEADIADAKYITVSETENRVKIEEPGTYVISGSSSDGSITVKKGTTGVVLVLEDLDLASSTGAPLSFNKGTEVKVLISGTVTLTDAENAADEFSADTETADSYDGAALKIKADSAVYITGEGTLNLIGKAKNGIKGGDNASLILDGPAISIAAVNDGVNMIYDLTILSGSVSINAGDDALHADHILTIGTGDESGPVIYVAQCSEGIEAEVVNIFGGNITLNASDDAINAAYKNGTNTPSINMTGGDVTINGQGDGFDSNGNINLIGGSAVINTQYRGGEAGIDYDGAYYISDSFQMNNTGGVSGPDSMGGGQGRGRGGWGRP